jgi:class 3 adenylate cyclase/pimeloyl-ACP methyl ester carboxylesterase
MPFQTPETRYALSGDVAIAYQAFGDGPIDLVYVPPVAQHVELAWESPPRAEFMRGLASFARVLVFDKRGTGMSDPVGQPATLETRMDDIRAVMDAAGSERAAVFGSGDATPLCVLFAATYPERTAALVLYGATPRFVRSPEFPWLPTRSAYEQLIDQMYRNRLEGAGILRGGQVRDRAPGVTEAELESFIRVNQLSVSPGAQAAYARMNLDIDVADVLPSIRVPTLFLHRSGDRVYDVRGARAMAAVLPGAQLIELPGDDHIPVFGDSEAILRQVETFLANLPDAAERELEPDRVLATVLFTDIVGSTAQAAELGDRGWRKLLEQHHTRIRAQLARFRGSELDTAGDGFFARFDGPARAIRCACGIRDAVGDLDLEVRAGLHTGECEVMDDKVAGIAVSIGARVAAKAQAGEVLVSQTVKDLVAGSGIEFEDRGASKLKGVPGEWRLYAVSDA